MTSLYVMVPLSFFSFCFLKQGTVLIFLEASKGKGKNQCIDPYNGFQCYLVSESVVTEKHFSHRKGSDRPYVTPTHSWPANSFSLTRKKPDKPGKVTCNHDTILRTTCLGNTFLLPPSIYSINLKDFVMALILTTS